MLRIGSQAVLVTRKALGSKNTYWPALAVPSAALMLEAATAQDRSRAFPISDAREDEENGTEQGHTFHMQRWGLKEEGWFGGCHVQGHLQNIYLRQVGEIVFACRKAETQLKMSINASVEGVGVNMAHYTKPKGIESLAEKGVERGGSGRGRRRQPKWKWVGRRDVWKSTVGWQRTWAPQGAASNRWPHGSRSVRCANAQFSYPCSSGTRTSVSNARPWL